MCVVYTFDRSIERYVSSIAVEAREKGREGGSARGSIEFDEGDELLRMHTPDMLINIGRLLAAQGAVGTLVSRRLAALVSEMAQHGVPPPVSVVTVWTVKFPGERIVQHVPSSRVLPRVSDKGGVVVVVAVVVVVVLVVVVVVVVGVESVTYKTSYHGQDHGRGRPFSLKRRLRGRKIDFGEDRKQNTRKEKTQGKFMQKSGKTLAE